MNPESQFFKERSAELLSRIDSTTLDKHQLVFIEMHLRSMYLKGFEAGLYAMEDE